METLEEIKSRIEAAVPEAALEIVANGSPCNQRSLLIDGIHALIIARFLRDDPKLRFDYLSNLTGVDWPEKIVNEKTIVRRMIDGEEKDVSEIVEKRLGGFLEAVYHLYSMDLKHGPLVMRMRTKNRSDQTHLPSLTAVWRSAELQEREVFDLYGIQFDGHPDLRRILMWDDFQDHPMRRDYVEPDDYEYEPTPHDKVLIKARNHNSEESKKA